MSNGKYPKRDYMRRPSSEDYATPEMHEAIRNAVYKYLSPAQFAKRGLYPLLEAPKDPLERYYWEKNREFPYTLAQLSSAEIPRENIDVPFIPTISLPILRGIPKSAFGVAPAEEMYFKQVDRLPALRRKVANPPTKGVTPSKKEIAWKYSNNPAHRELTAIYNKGEMSLEDIEPHFMQSINRDEAGLSVFDHTLMNETRRRLESADIGKTYAEKTVDITKGKRTNIKTGTEIRPMDTSQGCAGFCNECWAAYGGARQTRKCFFDPQPVRLTGDFYDDPYLLRRFGEVGDPNMHPQIWATMRDDFYKLIQRPEGITIEELDAFIEKSYDWSWTNNQFIKTNLHTQGNWQGKKYVPGGLDRTFLITKLQSTKNFNPLVTRNLEVSIDPMMPTHFFRSLKNIKQLKAQYGDNVNIMLRIRSIATSSDEINAMQKIAVDFANKHNLPVLETRVRFKHPEGQSFAQTLPEYYGKGQQKHISYYPTEDIGVQKTRVVKSEITKASRQSQEITMLETHTPDGPITTDVYIVRNWGEKALKTKTGVRWEGKKPATYEVWQGGNKIKDFVVKNEKQKMEMMSYAKQLAQDSAREQGILPSRITVARYSREESPLSQFGLHPDRHMQCNVFNIGGDACGACQGCRAWLKLEEARGMEKMKATALASEAGAVGKKK